MPQEKTYNERNDPLVMLRSAEAFSLAAEDYDVESIANPIVRKLRERTQRRMLYHWNSGQKILELNCGTGADAVFLGSHGIEVLATDASPRMIERTTEHIVEERLHSLVVPRVLEFSQLSQIGNEQFDGALSMFGGLNCEQDMAAFAAALSQVMNPGSKFIASFLGKYSMWEIVSILLRGNVQRAFRRWTHRAVMANVYGVQVPVWYWSVSELRAAFSPYFAITRIECWSAISPPPASIRLLKNHPSLCEKLFSIEEELGRHWPMNRLGDHVVVEFERTHRHTH